MFIDSIELPKRSRIMEGFADTVAVLVAGLNYPRPAEPGRDGVRRGGNVLPTPPTPYIGFCREYKDALLKNGVVDVVLTFDFLTGQVREFRSGGPKDGVDYMPRHGWTPLTLTNYRARVEKDGKDVLTAKFVDSEAPMYYGGLHDVLKKAGKGPKDDLEHSVWWDAKGASDDALSARDVYAALCMRDEGSVKELHFFGHAWSVAGKQRGRGGPLIVNCPSSYRSAQTGEPIKVSKTYDKDARRFDFDPHPDLAAILGKDNANLSACFAEDGFSMIWGCSADRALLRTIVTAKAKGTDPAAKRAIDDALRANANDTYAKRLAEASKRPVYAAPPGTGSRHKGDDIDSKNNGIRWWEELQLMRIDLSMYGGYLRYYKDEVGFKFATKATNHANQGHPEFGRGFITFAP